MNTPRKFRVWDGEEMHEPPHEYIYDPKEGARRVIDAINGALTCSQPIDCEVMFSTGLTDAEGTEIWEGDVLLFFGQTVVLHWDEQEVCGWATTPVDGGETVTVFAYQIDEGNATVIGNRYENPELLEETT
jgi:uncharacterized phage protein (TIGR01671 family)